MIISASSPTSAVRSTSGRVVLFLVISLATRAAVFGDWNYDVDDQFYALVGQRLVHGAMLYVDIWDRKGPLLYLTYAALAALAGSAIHTVVAYQLAATLATVWGACELAAIGARLQDARAGVYSGVAYCLLILGLGGAGGQTEVFYTPMMIAAAGGIVAGWPDLPQGRMRPRVVFGFACAGMAIAFKQAAVIEVSFFLLAVLWAQHLGKLGYARALTNGALLALVCALPLGLCTLWFWHTGHFAALWQALVLSNLHRAYMPWAERWHRLPVVAAELALPAGFAVVGWLNLARRGGEAAFVVAWCLVALGAIAAYPNLIQHYLITAIPALCVLASGLYGRRDIGTLALAGVALSVLPNASALAWQDRTRSRQHSAELVQYIRAVTPDHRLLVWGFPSYLYVLTASPPPSQLAFPPHLFDASEAHSSDRDQVAEVRRILATTPTTVIVQDPLPAAPLTTASVALVTRYAETCRREKSFVLYSHSGPEVLHAFNQCSGKAITPKRLAGVAEPVGV